MGNFRDEEDNELLEETVGCIGAILGVITIVALLVVLGPVINFVCGWISGLIILKIEFLRKAFILIFSTFGISISASNIPVICGGLSLVGGVFCKTSTSTSSRKKDKN